MREFRFSFAANDDSGIYRKDVADALGSRFAEIFGGYTLTESRGGYFSADGAFTDEPVFVFDVATRMPADELTRVINMTAIEVRRSMGREFVYFRNVDGKVHILAGPESAQRRAMPSGHSSEKYTAPGMSRVEYRKSLGLPKTNRNNFADGGKPAEAQRTATDGDKPAESVEARAAELRKIAESMAAADQRRGGGDYGGARMILATAADSYLEEVS